MLRTLSLALIAFQLLAADSYLFTSFRKNGETGTYFALSEDGLKWTPLNGNQPWIKVEHPGELMRDPFLVRGDDGTWHLLWTWGWDRKQTGNVLKIGHSTSKDLLTWSPHQEIPIFPNEPTARNAWAPEAAWDAAKKQWIIFWATTIPGRFPDAESAENNYTHRLYSMTTKDWKTFSEPALFFDPGFNAIDSTLVQDGKQWIMVFKDERRNPPKKNLRLAFASSPAGPWERVTESFSPAWVEGPSVARIGDEWWIYYDHYTNPRHYGATRTRDWKTFEEVKTGLSFPEDHRHGTVVKISSDLARKLKDVTR